MNKKSFRGDPLGIAVAYATELSRTLKSDTCSRNRPMIF